MAHRERPSEQTQFTRRRFLSGAAALILAPPALSDALGASAQFVDQPAPSPASPPHELAAAEEPHADETEHAPHESLSKLGYGTIALMLASFGQVIKEGNFTPYTSARSIGLLYATSAALEQFGNETDKHLAHEMKLEFTGVGGINLGLMGALPVITNVTKYVRFMAGNMLMGTPPEQTSSSPTQEGDANKATSRAVHDILHPVDINPHDQYMLDQHFAQTANRNLQPEDAPQQENEHVSLESVTISRINELVGEILKKEGASEARQMELEEFSTFMEGLFENKLQQIIGRGMALVDVVAPVGTTYLSTQVGNQLSSEVFEYKVRLEYMRQLREYRAQLVQLEQQPAFEPKIEDEVAPPTHLDEGLFVLEQKALCQGDSAVNSIRGYVGARVARAGNGSGSWLIGDPPLPFAYIEASKRGILPKYMAVNSALGIGGSLANGAATSAMLSERIIGERTTIDNVKATRAYFEGASILNGRIVEALKHPAKAARIITTGTDIKIDDYVNQAFAEAPDESLTTQDYTDQMRNYLESIKNGADPNIVIPVAKIVRQSVLGLARTGLSAAKANLEMIGTEHGRAQFVDRYLKLKLDEASHGHHHQQPDDLILQGEAVEYDEIMSRLQSWTPKEQMRYLRSLTYRYLTPGDFHKDSALGVMFAEDVLTDHPQLHELNDVMYTLTNQFVNTLRGKKNTEDSPITAADLAPEIKELFEKFGSSEPIQHLVEAAQPQLAKDKLADLSRAQAGYDLPYGELNQLSESASEVLYALTTQMPHVGALIEASKLSLNALDQVMQRMGFSAATKAQMKLALNSLLIMGVSSVADNVAASLFGLKTGELIIDELAAADESVTPEQVESLKFGVFVSSFSTAIHAGQNFKPGNGPNFAVERTVPDEAKLVVINKKASRATGVDQSATMLPLVDTVNAHQDSETRAQELKMHLRSRGENGFIAPMRIQKVPGWSAQQYQDALGEYGLHISQERIERFIINHPEDTMILTMRPEYLSDGKINTSPKGMDLKESATVTRHYPLQGLAVPTLLNGALISQI